MYAAVLIIELSVLSRRPVHGIILVGLPKNWQFMSVVESNPLLLNVSW